MNVIVLDQPLTQYVNTIYYKKSTTQKAISESLDHFQYLLVAQSILDASRAEFHHIVDLQN